MLLATNIVTCHRCPFMQKDCAGMCPCTIDGRDIVDHAKAGDCPKGKHIRGPHEIPPPPAPPKPRSLLGDWLQKLFAATGIEAMVKRRAARKHKPCGCAARQAKLNRWHQRILDWWNGSKSV